MKKRRNLLFGLGILMTLSMAVPVSAANTSSVDTTDLTTSEDTDDSAVYNLWKQEESGEHQGDWYLTDESGNSAESGLYQVNNDWYYIDEDGYLATGFYDLAFADDTELNGTYYFCEEGENPEAGLGAMLCDSWLAESEENSETIVKWYYLTERGKVADLQEEGLDGWQQPDEESKIWYFLTMDGRVDTSKNGWDHTADGIWLYAQRGQAELITGWQNISDKKWYHLDDGGKRDNNTPGKYEITDKVYFLNEDGVAQTGLFEVDHVTYYFDADTGKAQNVIQNPWLDLNGNRYLVENGEFAKGWRKINNIWYYMDPINAVMKTGFFTAPDGKKYYCDESGAMQTGWLQLSGSWYYFSGSGAMNEGWAFVNGNWYYLTPGSGMMKTGWYKEGNTWYYLSGSGAMQTGWLYHGGAWYYLLENGAMQEGWLKHGTVWYYLTPGSGMMKTGWYKEGNAWYYLSGNGAMQTGWLNQGGVWYYLSESGAMKEGWASVDGTWYYLTPGSGVMQTGWCKVGNAWYYLSGSGAMQESWIRLNGKRYYLTPGSGAMVTGWKYIGKYKYYFGNDGALVQDLDGVIGRQSSYYITVNRATCQIMVYAKDGANGYTIPVKTFACSVGMPSTPTPVGTFRTSQKLRWHTLMGPSYGQYCTRIVGGVLFHSVAGYNMTSYNLSAGEYNKLGGPASHGCVRLCVRDAKWIYDNCALGTTVTINDSAYAPFDKPATIKIPASQNWDPTDPNLR